MIKISKAASVALMAVLATASFAQRGWQGECISPDNDTPYSADYGTKSIRNQLIVAHSGVSGNVTYGGDGGPCYDPARQLDASGRFAFSMGDLGSVQSSFDDALALTTGAPADPVGDFCYAKILINGNTNATSELFGDGGLRVSYVGASKRYMISTWTTADVDVELEQKVIGNAVRMRWRMRNLAADTASLGLLWCAYVGMRTSFGAFDSTVFSNQANSALRTLSGIRKGFDSPSDNYIGYTVLDTSKPVRNERRYDSNNPKFPASVDFLFGQTEAYGMRVDNIAAAETPDANSADLFLIGNHGWFTGPGLIFGNNVRLNVFGDDPNNPNPREEADIFLNETSFVQRFSAVPVASGNTREIVHYVRANWGTADFVDPYTVVLDSPALLATDSDGTNGLTPNPFRFRAYIDNQYATLDREVQLRNVKLTIFLPDGITLAPGQTQQKTLATVDPNQVAFVEWSLRSDGLIIGDLPIRVTIEPTPGPVKSVTTTVRVSATPRLNLPAGANLVTIPYTFQDTGMDEVLGLQSGVDYQAFRWDPAVFGYLPATSVERGTGYWVVPLSDLGYRTLTNAGQPNDAPRGGLLVSLKQGWNLIGNPYSFPVRLSHLVLVSEDNPADSIPWIEAVNAGLIQSSLTYWNRDDALPNGGQYLYTQGAGDLLLPHRGYWVFSNTFKPMRIVWPPVFNEGLPDAGRSTENAFKQDDRRWRLQLSVRGQNGLDSQNFVGMLSDAKTAERNQVRKPPMAPRQKLELSIDGTMGGKPTRMAQAVTTRAGRQEWTVNVRAEEAGEYTLTWPNLASVPRGLRFRLTDVATGDTRDLRATTGYTFRMNDAGVRKLKVSVEVAGSSRPVIGNVLVTRPSRDNNAPVQVTYALSADALVTVRVLSSTGKEVFTVTRGRADNAGQNSVTWALRDSANRAVAPGVYRIEVIAETPGGDRVRKIVPVNVVR
jgi:hypothetical protein